MNRLYQVAGVCRHYQVNVKPLTGSGQVPCPVNQYLIIKELHDYATD